MTYSDDFRDWVDEMLIWSMRSTLMWNGDLGYVNMLTCWGSQGGRDHPSPGDRREGRRGQHWRGSAEVTSELVYTFSLVAYCDMVHLHCFPYSKWSGWRKVQLVPRLAPTNCHRWPLFLFHNFNNIYTSSKLELLPGITNPLTFTFHLCQKLTDVTLYKMSHRNALYLEIF